MKKKDDIIFLIDSQSYDRNIFGLTLEKVTNCRVFNFFSFEESKLYSDLKPSLILHDSNELVPNCFEGVDFLHISKDLIKNSFAPIHFNNTTMQEVAQAVTKILN